MDAAIRRLQSVAGRGRIHGPFTVGTSSSGAAHIHEMLTLGLGAVLAGAAMLLIGRRRRIGMR